MLVLIMFRIIMAGIKLHMEHTSQKEGNEVLESFDNLLLEILCNSDPCDNSDENYKSQVEKGIKELRSLYNRTYFDILIFVLIQLFNNTIPSNEFVVKSFTSRDVHTLRTCFGEQRIEFVKYRKKDCQHLQAYLLHLAVGLNQNIEVNSMKKLVKETAQMMRHVQPPLEQTISTEVTKFLNDECSASDFKKMMQHLMNAPSQQNTTSNSLKNVLQSEAIPYTRFLQAQDQSLWLKNDPDAHDLFKKLGLCKYYPRKLLLQDALCIRPHILNLSLRQSDPKDENELPFLILHKLMSYDTMCRSDLMPRGNISPPEDSDEDEDSEEEDNSYGIHPVDSLLALIICSDDFLRQDLFSRLAKCQLAVPFLLPDPFTKQLSLPLWALRSIIKEWYTTTDGTTVQQVQPIITYKMPVISFIRLGERQKHSKSKSKILNDVINDSNYNHFFHRDCRGGQYNLILGEGLVDMCWYLPAGNKDDSFQDAVTFLNLHGDARRFLKQMSSS